MKRKGNVLLKDIAAELDIPISTVSHALRNYDDISAAMKKKVWKKANEMGYIPNNLAVSLKSSKTNYIAIIFNSLANPFFSVMCEKLIKSIRAKGYEAFIFFYDSLYLTMKELEVPILNRCCGVVSFIECSEEASVIVDKRDFPIFVLGMNSKLENISCAFNDDYSGGTQVAEYCIKNGFQKVMYVGNNYTETSKYRREGFVNRLAQENRTCDLYLYGFAEKYEEKLSARIMNEQYDFVFFYNDEAAINMKHILLAKDYDMNKVKFIGFDNLTRYFSICEKMDSVAFDFDDIANFTASTIVNQIESGEIKKVKKIFPVSLVTY